MRVHKSSSKLSKEIETMKEKIEVLESTAQRTTTLLSSTPKCRGLNVGLAAITAAIIESKIQLAKLEEKYEIQIREEGYFNLINKVYEK